MHQDLMPWRSMRPSICPASICLRSHVISSTLPGLITASGISSVASPTSRSCSLCMHRRTGCRNENLNSCHSKDTPKAIFYSVNFEARSWLSVLRNNLDGTGAAVWLLSGATLVCQLPLSCKRGGIRWTRHCTRTGAAKTAFADSIEPSAPASMTDFNPATVTAEIALTLKGKNLAAALISVAKS